MTVLFFSRFFYPNIGGVEKHVSEVGKRLVKNGFKVMVITENYNTARSKSYHSLPSSDRIEGIEVIRIKAGKEGRLKKFRVWLQLLKHFSVIKSADIIHCHDIFYWYLPFRFVFPLKKIYTTFHGYEGNNFPTRKAIFMHKVAEKLSNGNICIGDFLKKWYGTKPTYITYGAVGKVKSSSKNYDKNLIIFLGRLEEETGIMEYLKAFKTISKKYKKLKLLVLGDGSQREEAENFVRENKIDVEFKGFVENTAEYMQRTSFVFVSRYLGILESIMSKKFVLAVYNNKIKKDYLQMTPFSAYISISAGSKGIEADLIKYLSDEKRRNEKIDKAYEWVKDKTWEKMVSLYIKLWEIT